MAKPTLILFCFLLAFGTSCSGWKQDDENSTQTPAEHRNLTQGDLWHLKALEGKYPKESGFFSDTMFTQRLQKLVGPDYDFMRDTCIVESPVEVEGSIVSASGCEAHNCGASNFIVIADLEANVLYAGVRKNNDVKTFSENGKTIKQLTYFVSRF